MTSEKTKNFILDYYETLINRVYSYTEDLLNNCKDDQLVTVPSYEIHPNNDYKNAENYGIESYLDPYKEEYKLEKLSSPPETTKTRDYLNSIRSEAIQELRGAQEANIDEFEKNKSEYTLDPNQMNATQIDELRGKLFGNKFCFLLKIDKLIGFNRLENKSLFKLYVIVLDFYLNQFDLELLGIFMNGDFEGSVNSQLTKEREKRHKKELEEENAITKINLDKNTILAHLMKKCLLTWVRNSTKSNVIKISKKELFSIQKILFWYIPLGSVNLIESSFLDFSSVKSFEINSESPTYLKELQKSIKLISLNGLPNLEYLTIDGLLLGPKSFLNFTRLRKLALYNCDMSQIDADWLSSLNTSLEVLINRQPKNSSKASYKGLSKLKWLHLSFMENYNFIRELSPDLEVLEIHLASIDVEIAKEIFKDFKHLTLKAFDLYNNQLERFDGKWLSGLSSLRHLKLTVNAIETIDLSFDFLSNLESLDLSSNEIDSLEGCLPKLKNIKTLNLSYNARLKISSGFFIYMNNLERLHLASIDKINLGKDFLSGLSKLTTLDIKYNSIIHLNPDVFIQTPNLTHLDMSGCEFKLDSRTFTRLPKLKSLNLTNTHLSHLEEDVFMSLGELEVLILADNDLTEIHPSLLASLHTLRELDLRKNCFKTLDLNFFSFLDNLKEVDLSDNPIVEDNNELVEFFKKINVILLIDTED